MGFRFRKSINLGGGFRVNLSKSGVGYSWGIKGVRFTRTAKGRSRSTFSVPGTGLSYTTESGGHRRNTKRPSQTAPINHTGGGTTMLWSRFLICFFLGILGVHQFIEGKTGKGLLYLFTGGLFGIGWLIDCIRYLSAALNQNRAPVYAPPLQYNTPETQSPAMYTPPAEVPSQMPYPEGQFPPPAEAQPPVMPPNTPFYPVSAQKKTTWKTVLRWIVIGIAALFGLGCLFGDAIMSLIFALLFIALVVPYDPWQNTLRRLLKKPLRIALSVVLVLLCVFCIPTSDTAPDDSAAAVTEEVTAAPEATPSPAPTASPTPTAKPSPTPTPKPSPTAEPSPESTPAPADVPAAAPATEETPAPTPVPTPESTEAPVSESNPSAGGTENVEDSGTTEEEVIYVWIPQSGSRYHSHSGCSNMIDPSKVTLSEAEAWGFTPCQRCY